MSGDLHIFRELVRVFEEAQAPYCILAGYDQMPENIGSDIDFMIHPAWAPRLPALIRTVAERSGAHIVQCIHHETTAAYFVLARLRDGAVTYLQPDSSTDYRRAGRLWLRAETVLHGRRRHWYGFWVPSAANAFTYYLIKKIEKGALSYEQGTELSLRFAEDPESCEQALHRLFFASSARAVTTAARSNVWSPVMWSMPVLQMELHERVQSERLPDRLLQLRADLRRVLARLAQPTGLCIAFLGADGSGKSTLMQRVGAELRESFRQVRYRHLRPGLFLTRRAGHGPVLDPHGKAARGTAGSLLKLAHFWSDYVLGGLLWLYPLRVRSTLVIFDRYYHDLLVDPLRYRYGAPLAPARWLGRLVPQPDLSFVLDAPVEVLQARKQEVSPAECERQRRAYVDAATEMRGACVVDASRPVEEVVARVLAQVIEHLEARTAVRLDLQPGAQ